MQAMIYSPEPGVALVKLIPPYSGIEAPKKTYDSIQEGEIISLHQEDMEKKSYLVGAIGHWRQFKDDLRLKHGLAFIELKDIFGYHKEDE